MRGIIHKNRKKYMRKNYMQRGFSVVEVGIIVVVVAIVGLLGWKFYDAQQAKKATVSNAVETPSVDMVPGDLAHLADLDALQKDALADKQGVTVVHVELEETTAGVVYKAELSDGTVTVYNARTGKRQSSTKVADKTSEALPTSVTAGISFARALEVAKAEKPNSKVFKIELEREGGVVVYSVRFTDKARVDVSAADGSVVRTKAAKVEEKSGQPGASPQRQATERAEEHAAEVPHTESGLTENDDDDASDSSTDSGTSGHVEDDSHSGTESDNSDSGKTR